MGVSSCVSLLRPVLVSSLCLVLASCRLAAPSSRLAGTERALSGRYDGRLAIVVPARLSSRLVVSKERGGFCVLVPCRRVSSAVSFSHSLRSSPFVYARPFVVVGVGRLGALACDEVELTKTARFAIYPSPSHQARPPWRGDMGIGPGRTAVRRGAVAGPFGRPGCRICPHDVSAKQSSHPLIPRPGGGGTFEAGG